MSSVILRNIDGSIIAAIKALIAPSECAITSALLMPFACKTSSNSFAFCNSTCGKPESSAFDTRQGYLTDSTLLPSPDINFIESLYAEGSSLHPGASIIGVESENLSGRISMTFTFPSGNSYSEGFLNAKS